MGAYSELVKRARPGQPPKYDNPEDLWEDFVKYVGWAEKNPIKGKRIVIEKGKAVQIDLDKIRAITAKGFRIYAGISTGTWANYRKDEDFLTIVEAIDDFCFTLNYEGAAAEELNASLISRKLGLYDTVKQVGEKPAIHVHTRNSEGVNKLIKGLEEE